MFVSVISGGSSGSHENVNTAVQLFLKFATRVLPAPVHHAVRVSPNLRCSRAIGWRAHLFFFIMHLIIAFSVGAWIKCLWLFLA